MTSKIPKKMGALSPYEVYTKEVKPYIDELESQKGTLEYFNYYRINWQEIESKREKYLGFLPAMLMGTALMKIVFDYYRSLDYKVEDKDGTDIDQEYSIDLIATKENEIIVAQVKSGEMSKQEVKKFCTKAPKYILEFQGDKEQKELVIMASKLDEYANTTFVKYGTKLKEKGFILHRLVPEDIRLKLPKYSRHFKEWKKIHST